MPKDQGFRALANGKPKIDGGGSATAFAAVAGARWNLCNGTYFWANMDTSATVSVYEIDSSNSTVIVTFMTSATTGIYSTEFGDHGFQASQTNTRLMFNTGAVAGTIGGIFTGFYTGS